jgi:hypothetical protein
MMGRILHPTSYDWEFVSIAGQTFTDSGSAACVSAGNRPPLAVDDTRMVTEGGTLVVSGPGMLGNDSDPANDPLTVNTAPSRAPANGPLTLNADGSYSYTHDGSETAGDSSVYQVCEPGALCDTATVTLIVPTSVIFLPVIMQWKLQTGGGLSLA